MNHHPHDESRDGGGYALAPAPTHYAAIEKTGVRAATPPPSVLDGDIETQSEDNSPRIKLNKPKYINYVQSVTDNLSGIDERLLNPTTRCTPRFLAVDCKCGMHAVGQACAKRICKNCEKYYGMKRARRVFDRILSLSFKRGDKIIYPKIIYTVFTIPEHLRYKYIDPKKVYELRSEIFKLLKTHYHAVWAIEATHPISEDEPNKFHPHFNFLWQVEDGESSYLPVNRLRKHYAGLLGFSMLDINDESIIEKRVDAYTKYKDKPGTLWKWSQYVTRIFSEFAEWIGNIRYFGAVPKLPPREKGMCPICKEKLHVLGYLCPEKNAEFMEFDPESGRPPPGLDWTDINFFNW